MLYLYRCLWVMFILSCVNLSWSDPRVLLVGDSWAANLWDQNAFQIILEQEGLSEFEVVGMNTAIGGTTAQEWANNPEMLDLITTELENNPSIDTVLLYIGGNDVIFSLFEDFNLNRLFNALPNMVTNINTIADHILSIRPSIRLLLSEYDYLPIERFFFITSKDIIDVVIEAAQLRLALTQEKERMFYVFNLGLMQHTFGLPGIAQPGELPLPGGPPDHHPLVGGDPNLNSPEISFSDPIHLSRDGYLVLAERIVDLYWRDWLLNPLQPASVNYWDLY